MGVIKENVMLLHPGPHLVSEGNQLTDGPLRFFAMEEVFWFAGAVQHARIRTDANAKSVTHKDAKRKVRDGFNRSKMTSQKHATGKLVNNKNSK